MKVSVKSVVFLFLQLIVSCESYYILTGGRLGDFPSPDESKHIPLTTSQSFFELKHHCGKIPFHVNVYAYSTEGDEDRVKMMGKRLKDMVEFSLDTTKKMFLSGCLLHMDVTKVDV